MIITSCNTMGVWETRKIYEGITHRDRKEKLRYTEGGMRKSNV